MKKLKILSHHKVLLLHCTLFLLGMSAILGCSQKKKDANAILSAVQQTGKLVTVEYTVSKVVKAADNQTWFKMGDRKILMSCEAILKAGIDLQGINPKNAVIEDTSIRLTLPHAQLFSLSIPPEKIIVHYQQVDFFRDAFTAAEREALLAQAEQQIRTLADSMGILQTAEKNATLYLQKLLQQSGFKKVTITYQ